MTLLCFVDTETTGLDPDLHEIWEVAIILRDVTDAGVLTAKDVEFVWQLPVDLGRADPIALNIGRFSVRRAEAYTSLGRTAAQRDRLVVRTDDTDHALSLDAWCQRFARLTWDAHMIGCVPSFDTERLARLLRANGACPGWHYQPVDVEAVAAGYLLGTVHDLSKNWHGGALVRSTLERASLPWGSDDLAGHLGVVVDEDVRHTALGDARFARDVWDAVHDRSDVDVEREELPG